MKESSSRMEARWLALIAASIAIAYAVLWLSLGGLPFMDLPNHFSRAEILRDLIFHSGSRFGREFEFHLVPVTYLLGDTVLMVYGELFGPDLGPRLWVLTCFFSLPLAIVLYLHVLGLGWFEKVIAFLFSLYQSSDWFFMAGFHNYRLGTALFFIAAAAWERSQERAGVLRYLWFLAVAISCYFTHLSPFVFLGLALGVSLIVRCRQHGGSPWPSLLRLSPLALVLLFHLLRGSGGGERYYWRTPVAKLTGLFTPFVRFSYIVDGALLLLLGVIFFLLIRQARESRLKHQRFSVYEICALSTAFLLAYLVLPLGRGQLYDLDNRAIPFVLHYLFFAGLRGFAGRSQGSPRPALLSAAVALLALGNLAYLAEGLVRRDRELLRYREVVEHVPQRAAVFPISTRQSEGRIHTLLHAGCLATAHRDALTPYLFSGNGGFTMEYFRYREQRYAPSRFWYSRDDGKVDWPLVQMTYEYVLATTPFDPGRVKLPLEPIFANETAALFRIVNGGSRGYFRER